MQLLTSLQFYQTALHGTAAGSGDRFYGWPDVASAPSVNSAVAALSVSAPMTAGSRAGAVHPEGPLVDDRARSGWSHTPGSDVTKLT